MEGFIWDPADHPWTRESNVAVFMRQHGFETHHQLRARSVEDIDWFWDAAMKDIGVEWQQPYTRVRDSSKGFPWTRWFIDGQLNLVFNVLDRHCADAERADWTALICVPEAGEHRYISFRELGDMVNKCANAMKASGIARGDFVGLYAPMWVEMVAVFYAAMKIGARIVPVFCGFGQQALEERLEASGCKLLFAAKTLSRRGSEVDVGSTAQAVAERLACVQQLIFLDTEDWPQFLGGHERHCDCEVLPAEEPCLVIYTSGTTGRPKGTVHTHAGCLAQMGKELRYAFDVKARDTFFWFTDIGWMMGPWELIGCHLHGAAVVLYDGAPDYPGPGRIWREVDRLGVRTLGISPTAIRLLMRSDERYWPKEFPKLEILGSTGEPWDASSYRWFFEKVGGGRCPVINISGGTEIVGCLLSPLPVEPLKPCSLGGAGLGMDVDVFDEEGRPVRGAVGHLVCKQPAPSMTKSFLNDDERYLATYFSRFGENVWYHGDWASIDEDAQWFLHGRSDDTIKIAGKRLGPSEVESALIKFPGVSEAAAIGVPHELKGQALVCFVVMKGGAHFDERALCDHVAAEIGKPLRPQRIFAVAALPKTRSGKIVRGTITRVYCGEEAGDVSSIENPAALDGIAAARKVV